MADVSNAANAPAGFDLYAGYVDGRYRTYAPLMVRYGAGRVLPIAVFSTTNAGIVGDCESGDMTPQTAVNWVVMRRLAGADPTIYCSLALWATVQAAFHAAGVPQPHWWIAAYPGNGQSLYAGAIAHQWIDRGPYDESVVADFWPGFDSGSGPVPVPPTPPVPPPVGTTIPITANLGGPMQRTVIDVPTDLQGNGCLVLDGGKNTLPGVTSSPTSVDSASVVSVGGWGSNPTSDKPPYWPGDAKWQDHGGHPLLTVTGGTPKGQFAVVIVTG